MFPEEICHCFVLCLPTITSNGTLITLFIDQLWLNAKPWSFFSDNHHSNLPYKKKKNNPTAMPKEYYADLLQDFQLILILL